MTATAERIPTRGDTVTLRSVEQRPSTFGKEMDPLIYEVNVLITKSYPDLSMVMGVELSRFSYVEGLRGKGRNLPPVNPYGDPKHNGYQIGVWTCID